MFYITHVHDENLMNVCLSHLHPSDHTRKSLFSMEKSCKHFRIKTKVCTLFFHLQNKVISFFREINYFRVSAHF